MAVSLNLDLKSVASPTGTAGMFWVKKSGYYIITSEKEKADDWILILDESIGIGKEKMLLILAIRRSQTDFTRPLTAQDMTPMVVKSSENWNGENIFAELAYCKQQSGKVIYAATDGDSTLKKALRLAGIAHVYDVTHALARILEKLYGKDDIFMKLTKDTGAVRLKYCCSKYAHIMPPSQRSKSRFLNLEIISAWGIKVIKTLDSKQITKEERDLLLWIYDLKPFFLEIEKIMSAVEKISVLLKNNGLNQQTYKECLKILQTGKTGERQKVFNSLFVEYLDNNLKQRSSKKETLLCTDDIIETIFGRYRNELNQNPMNGITDMALIIPAMTSTLTEDEIMKAIDGNTAKQINEWQKNNLCDSLSVKRNEFFNIGGAG
jgi:hypothetical protein